MNTFSDLTELPIAYDKKKINPDVLPLSVLTWLEVHVCMCVCMCAQEEKEREVHWVIG